jgi:hypothetical protein
MATIPKILVKSLYELAEPLRQLTVSHHPDWGRMNPQMMVEHMVDTLNISNGTLEAPLLMPPDKLPILRKQLLSDMPLPHNFQNPWVSEQLRTDSLQTALDKMSSAIDLFYAYFKNHPDAKPVHPIYGPLSQEEWIWFHQKHFTHHLQQFRLIPESQG